MSDTLDSERTIQLEQLRHQMRCATDAQDDATAPGATIYLYALALAYLGAEPESAHEDQLQALLLEQCIVEGVSNTSVVEWLAARRWPKFAGEPS